jgi:hypothetical protein
MRKGKGEGKVEPELKYDAVVMYGATPPRQGNEPRYTMTELHSR